MVHMWVVVWERQCNFVIFGIFRSKKNQFSSSSLAGIFLDHLILICDVQLEIDTLVVQSILWKWIFLVLLIMFYFCCFLNTLNASQEEYLNSKNNHCIDLEKIQKLIFKNPYNVMMHLLKWGEGVIFCDWLIFFLKREIDIEKYETKMEVMLSFFSLILFLIFILEIKIKIFDIKRN